MENSQNNNNNSTSGNTPPPSSGVIEFLNELGEAESLAALRDAYSSKAPFIFKSDLAGNPIKVFIETFADKKIYFVHEIPGKSIPLGKEFSIKFNLGTEVFFIKTSFKIFMNRFFVDSSTKVIQLKRRKEPRFVIPKAWPQTAAILISANDSIKCNVIDISNSGIRFEILEEHPDYKRDDFLKLKFQIHKRGEVTANAVVRFIIKRPNSTTLLGMEFIELSNSNQSRVMGTVADIQIANSVPK